MFYYSHHIGDFLRDTSNLTDHQLVTYLRMIWAYYHAEEPLSGSDDDIAFAVRSDAKTVRQLLRHYFVETDGKWFHVRCEKEIANYHHKQDMARRSAEARWKNAKEMRTHSEGIADGTKNDANREPRTENQRKNTEPIGSLSAAKLPDCPHVKILELWAKHCPTLPQPRTWEGNRRTSLKARWLQAAKPSAYSPDGYKTEQEGLEWWGSFFDYIAESKLGKGFSSPGREWKPDLEWVVNATNFQKIIDGKYSA